MAVPRKAMTEGIRTPLFPGIFNNRTFTIPQSQPSVRRLCQLPLHKGAFDSVLNLCVNVLTDTPEIPHNFIIGNSQNLQAIALEKGCSFRVFFHAGSLKVLRTIQFNDQFGLCAVKIRNILAQNFLSGESGRVCPEIVVPKVTFFFGHFLAQLFREGNHLAVVL